MKKIILFFRYPLTNKVGEAVIVPVESLQENLWELCKKACPSGRYFSFERYYGKSDLMSLGRMFPYILRDNRYIWNVLYSEVTVKEFLDTHELNEQDMIQVEVDNVGSAGEEFLHLIQEWVSFAKIVSAVDWIGRGMTVCSIVKGVCSSFGKKKAMKPKIQEFYHFLTKRSQWNLQYLSRRLGAEEAFLKSLLLTIGFEEDEKGIYVFNNEKNERFCQLCLSYTDILSDKHGLPINCYSINNQVSIINRNMIYLKLLCSEIQENCIWPEAEKKLRVLVCKNPEALILNEDGMSICIKEILPKNFGYEEESELYCELENLNTYLDKRIWPLEELLEREE